MTTLHLCPGQQATMVDIILASPRADRGLRKKQSAKAADIARAAGHLVLVELPRLT